MTARVRFCTWCRQFAVLGAQPDDHVTISFQGELRAAVINGAPVVVGDGICEQCQAAHFPETVKKSPMQRVAR